MEDLPKDKKIILFDGVCNLCDKSVQVIIKNDKKDNFRFVALQSELGEKILNHINIDRSKTDSIILYEPGNAYYYKSQAAIKIAENMDGLYNLLGLFQYLPVSLSDTVYDYIAKNRYKWYGKKDQCMIPTKETLNKFL
ncbi:DCC1-like thiol-disulfide oxidoreductase family protein [uncultured Flavobacterium sp.]|uniref:thiol-disulfide oxidoreductase DCC family protein n=1 Tax=uncultured Flavobacterium sp. TaxID=165435 RepID=UPI0030EBE0A2